MCAFFTITFFFKKKKAQIYSTSEFLADEISSFIQESRSLKTLIMRIKIEVTERIRLQEILPTDWKIEKEMSTGRLVKMFLERYSKIMSFYFLYNSNSL